MQYSYLSMIGSYLTRMVANVENNFCFCFCYGR